MSYRIFSTFAVVLLVLGRPECSSSSADTRPALKRECHSKHAVRLKECSPKAPSKHFKGCGTEFTELHAKLVSDTLLDFAIHRKQTKHEVEKVLL
jgi:hypothetical protein